MAVGGHGHDAVGRAVLEQVGDLVRGGATGRGDRLDQAAAVLSVREATTTVAPSAASR